MRAWISLFVLIGCSSDVQLGSATWRLVTPEATSDGEGGTFSRVRDGGVVIEFRDVDIDAPSSDGRDGVYCSDVDTARAGSMRIELTDRAAARIGTVPVTPTFDPSIAGAWVTTPLSVYEMGSVELTEVGDTLVGSFAASGLYDTGGPVMLTGTFYAPRCD